MYRVAEISITLRTCIISCLPKGDKSREYLKNWRPISSLSVLHTLAFATMANHLKQTLRKLISKSQTGFISGSFIGESTRLAYDIIHYVDENNLQGMLMLIDFFQYTKGLLTGGPNSILFISIMWSDYVSYGR